MTRSIPSPLPPPPSPLPSTSLVGRDTATDSSTVGVAGQGKARQGKGSTLVLLFFFSQPSKAPSSQWHFDQLVASLIRSFLSIQLKGQFLLLCILIISIWVLVIKIFSIKNNLQFAFRVPHHRHLGQQQKEVEERRLLSTDGQTISSLLRNQ